jgi:hypothetical protein
MEVEVVVDGARLLVRVVSVDGNRLPVERVVLEVKSHSSVAPTQALLLRTLRTTASRMSFFHSCITPSNLNATTDITTTNKQYPTLYPQVRQVAQCA